MCLFFHISNFKIHVPVSELCHKVEGINYYHFLSVTGNKVNNIDVVYTPWSNLKKTASMDVGQVGFHNPKMVSLNVLIWQVDMSISILFYFIFPFFFEVFMVLLWMGIFKVIYKAFFIQNSGPNCKGGKTDQ